MIILTHLGESEPPYLKDCIHQLSLFQITPILILDPYHKNRALGQLNVKHIYTDTLTPTQNHRLFSNHYYGNTQFRNNYWKYVKERFFFIEEAMEQLHLENCVAMEYDVLVYTEIESLLSKLSKYAQNKLAFVMDTPDRGHPGFLFVQNSHTLSAFNEFIVDMIKLPLSDMELLSMFKRENPEKACCLPVITQQRNLLASRTSILGNIVEKPDFLSEGFDELGVLFDSAVVGQWVGGVDPRNMDKDTIGYENEEALYSVKEVGFAWKKIGEKWLPFLDGQPLATIHVHSKALNCFFSDSTDTPRASYTREVLLKGLEHN